MAPQPSKWVRLINNATGTAYVSSGATDSTGLWSISNVPTGVYTVYSGTSATGPWSATGDGNYEVSGLDGSPTATPNYGLVNIGAGPWDGITSGFFAGHASGTVVATNAASGFGGNLLDYQVAGASRFRVSAAGAGIFGAVATATANFGTLSVGGAAWDGVTAGKFVGSASGTVLAVNAASGFAGSLLDLQLAGVQKLKVDQNGLTMAAGTKLTADSGTATGAAGAATLNKQTGTITTETLTTAALGVQGYTVSNSLVTTTSQVFVAVRNGTNNVQPVYATNIVPGSGLFTVDFRNGHASLALTGSLKFAFWVLS